MDNTTKILIIIIIVLVGVLGLVGGYFLQVYLVKNNNSTVSNLTNASVNVENNTSSSVNSNVGDYDPNIYYVAYCRNCGAAFLNKIDGVHYTLCPTCIHDPDVNDLLPPRSSN